MVESKGALKTDSISENSLSPRNLAEWIRLQEFLVDRRKLKAEIDRLEHQNSQRINFAVIFVIIAFLWIAGMCVMLVLTGIKNNGFELNDAVLIMMLGAGTVNVMGPAFMLSRYLFGNGKRTIKPNS